MISRGNFGISSSLLMSEIEGIDFEQTKVKTSVNEFEIQKYAQTLKKNGLRSTPRDVIKWCSICHQSKTCSNGIKWRGCESEVMYTHLARYTSGSYGGIDLSIFYVHRSIGDCREIDKNLHSSSNMYTRISIFADS